MTPRNYDIEKSNLIVLVGEAENSYRDVWAIFEVPKRSAKYIAIHWEKKHPNESNWIDEILTTFDDVTDLLYWCAYKSVKEFAVFRGGKETGYGDDGPEWLHEICLDMGYSDFYEYIADLTIFQDERSEDEQRKAAQP